MKWTLRYAALFLALAVVLGAAGMMTPEVAAANDDVVFMDPPNDRGDPDGGGGIANRFGWRLALGPPRGPFGLRKVSLVRAANVSQPGRTASVTHQRAARR